MNPETTDFPTELSKYRIWGRVTYRRDIHEVQYYCESYKVWRTITRDARSQQEAQDQLALVQGNHKFQEWTAKLGEIVYRIVRVQSVCEVLSIENTNQTNENDQSDIQEN